MSEGFPGGPGVKKFTLKCKGHSFNPWSGKIPRARGRLSLTTATTGPVDHRACAQQQGEPAHRNKELTVLAEARESPRTATTAEPALGNKGSHRSGKPAHCNEEPTVLAAARESPRTATETQRNQKNNKYCSQSPSTSHHLHGHQGLSPG